LASAPARLAKITADCPKKRNVDMSDQCTAWLSGPGADAVARR
jgi:hypothetical protein